MVCSVDKAKIVIRCEVLLIDIIVHLGALHEADTHSPFPVRLSNAMKQVVTREKKAQQAKGLHSYDYTATSQGTIEPAPLSDVFIGPNGLSLRPAGRAMYELVTSKKAL